jgi:subfamily B ATP-binding cassette protein MsbA
VKQLREIFAYARPYRQQILLFFLLMLLSSLFSVVSIGMAIPFLNIIFGTEAAMTAPPSGQAWMQKAFGIFAMVRQQQGAEKALLLLSGVLVILFFFKNLFRYLALRVLTPIRTGIVKNLRQQMYEALLSWPTSRFTDSRKGDILARFSADVQELEWAVFNSITSLFRDPITILVTLVAMILLSPALTLFILILLPVSAFIIGRIGRSLKRTAHLGQNELGRLTSITEETLSNMRVIKSFGAEFALRQRFHAVNDHFTALSRRMINKRELSSPLSEFSGSVVIAIIISVGGMMVLRGGPGAPDAASFITFIALFSQIITPAKAVTTTFYNIQKGRASAARIQEIIQAEKEIPAPAAKVLEAPKQGINVINLSHRYGDRTVLQGIHLTVQAGRLTALVGPSGAGKSTLADLLAGLIPVQEGQIFWDDTPYREMPLAVIRASVAIVPQTHMLFNETARFNITLGREPTDEMRLREACRQAYAWEFLADLPQGLDTPVGEQGGRLSGGQKQRLALARAFYKEAPVLILDEATANLDPASEEQVQQALRQLISGRTTLVIAHRLHTVQHADTIVVLNQGMIVDQGRHEELLQRCKLYQELVSSGFKSS